MSLCSTCVPLLLWLLIASASAESAFSGQKISWRKARGRVNCTTDPKYFCGRVKSVHDGDSLRIVPDREDKAVFAASSVAVRLMQIDAPELRQDYGRESRNSLKTSLPKGTRVCVISPGHDHYRRVLGFVCLADDDVNYRMLAEGHAWCYQNACCRGYAAAADAARTAGLGLWKPGKTPMAPWVYRRLVRRRARKQHRNGSSSRI